MGAPLQPQLATHKNTKETPDFDEKGHPKTSQRNIPQQTGIPKVVGAIFENTTSAQGKSRHMEAPPQSQQASHTKAKETEDLDEGELPKTSQRNIS